MPGGSAALVGSANFPGGRTPRLDSLRRPTILARPRPLGHSSTRARGDGNDVALIPEDKIAEIRDRTDIVQIIGGYVPLRRSGPNWKGLCPFHAERTPSFNVNQPKQMYHCFGCGKSGDVIRFLMEHDGRPFIEVVRELAKRAGI